MGMGFAPTWLRQVSPTASQNHFNHCTSRRYCAIPPLAPHQEANTYSSSLPSSSAFTVVIGSRLHLVLHRSRSTSFLRSVDTVKLSVQRTRTVSSDPERICCCHLEQSTSRAQTDVVHPYILAEAENFLHQLD